MSENIDDIANNIDKTLAMRSIRAEGCIKKWIDEYVTSDESKQNNMCDDMIGLLELSKDTVVLSIKNNCETIKMSLDKLIKSAEDVVGKQ